MERARSAIVVDAIADVGILLNLSEQNALAYRVNRSRRNKNHVAAPRRNSVKHFKERIVFYAGDKFFLRNFFIEAAIQLGIFGGVEDIPHFAFAELLFMNQRVRVGRVNLQG